MVIVPQLRHLSSKKRTRSGTFNAPIQVNESISQKVLEWRQASLWSFPLQHLLLGKFSGFPGHCSKVFSFEYDSCSRRERRLLYVSERTSLPKRMKQAVWVTLRSSIDYILRHG